MPYKNVGRPLFLPHRQKPYVATQPFRWKGEYLQPGDEVPEWPLHHLMHLARQGMIGPKDHQWTLNRIESWKRRIAASDKRKAERLKRQAPALAAQAEAAEEAAEAASSEARSLRERIGGFFGGGGESDGGPAGSPDPA